MVHRYSSHNDCGRNRTILLGGRRLSGIPQRCSAGQLNVGILSVRISKGSVFTSLPVKMSRASSPARFPKASMLATAPPTAPVPKLASVMTYTGTLADSPIVWAT